jgi:hypothetical protein
MWLGHVVFQQISFLSHPLVVPHNFIFITYSVFSYISSSYSRALLLTQMTDEPPPVLFYL